MALNMKTLTQALAKTAAVIEKTVHTTVQEVTGPKPLQDYDLLDQIGSAGPGLAWKLYSAKARDSHNLSQQYPTVCVWVLDKRALSEARTRAGLSKAAEDSFLDIIRADAARLVRLRHPGVVHVVQSLDETKNAMAMVTEPLFASVANVLGNVENVEKVPKVLKGMEMGLLEMKHGLLQIAETLDFLHNNARLIHRAICPETVLITSNGAWKLSGFGFTISADQSADSAGLHGFHYTEYDDDDSVLPLQPSLNYTAPELVRSKASSVGCSSDIFSFGCLAYHLIARKPLFDCHNNVKMYMNNLTYLSSGTFSSIPPELVAELQKMLSANESIRPQALDFTASSFFRDDTRLRALRFLDHMLERDNMQKSEFLKALTDMWKDFDSRVLRYKVLPPLCAELRNMVMQPMILPMVLTIAESQDRIDFELSTLPALVPVLSTAAGETLLLLVRHCDLIITKASHDHLVSHVLPMLVRAYDDNDARLQEEVLKKTTSLAKQLDVQLVKKTILPRVHGLALKTTVAAVRVNALFCLSDMVHMLDKHAVLDILQTIQRCTAVDRSAPTLMCTLGVANSILKQCGIEFTSEHVLPLLTPLLVAQQLNVQQFAKYMLFVKGVLRQIEEKRGVTLNSYGVPEVRSSAAAAGVADGHLTEAVKKITATPPSTTRSTPAWDEDWIPKSMTQISSTKNLSSIQSSAVAIEPIQVSTANPVASLLSGQQASSLPSCPAVDLEWPPRSSFDGTSTVSAKQDSSIDIDPFADWPPRHSGSSSSTPGSFNNGTTTVMPTTYNSAVNAYNLNGMSTTQASSWSFPQNFGEPLGQNQGMNSSGQNSLGFLKQNHGNSVLGSSSEKAMDLGSIFGSSKSEQMAPRLAPPPSTAVGRGRGKGRGRGQGQVQGRSSHVKSSSEQQPSLLDLL